MDKDTIICDKCAHYDGRYCMTHAEYGEVCERDKCEDYAEVYNANNNR